MSEVLNEQVGQEEKGGISRRRVAAGVAWSLPVIATAIAAPAAAASGPTPTPTATPASASFTTGTQTITSTTSSQHNRAGVTVPATLNLKDLGRVSGSITVDFTISPQPAASKAPIVSLATVTVGSQALTFTPSPAGNTFKTSLSYPLPAGATTLAFLLSYSYGGTKNDTGTYAVTTVITFQEGTTTKQLSSNSSITLA